MITKKEIINYLDYRINELKINLLNPNLDKNSPDTEIAIKELKKLLILIKE